MEQTKYGNIIKDLREEKYDTGGTGVSVNDFYGTITEN